MIKTINSHVSEMCRIIIIIIIIINLIAILLQIILKLIVIIKREIISEIKLQRRIKNSVTVILTVKIMSQNMMLVIQLLRADI